MIWTERLPMVRECHGRSPGAERTNSTGAPAASQQEAADYIAGLTVGLMQMATSANMPFLAYLLDMAAQEAMQQGGMPRRRRAAKQQKPRPVRTEAPLLCSGESISAW
jgi:hypothetical protein